MLRPDALFLGKSNFSAGNGFVSSIWNSLLESTSHDPFFFSHTEWAIGTVSARVWAKGNPVKYDQYIAPQQRLEIADAREGHTSATDLRFDYGEAITVGAWTATDWRWQCCWRFTATNANTAKYAGPSASEFESRSSKSAGAISHHVESIRPTTESREFPTKAQRRHQSDGRRASFVIRLRSLCDQ